MSEVWITTTEAAEISGYHPEYVRHLVRSDLIKAKKFGVIWQVDRMSLNGYLIKGQETGDKRYGSK